MSEKYLVINAGSSSLKFSLYDMPIQKEIVSGYVEKIGQDDSFYTLKFGDEKIKKEVYISDHGIAIKCMLDELLKNKFIDKIEDIKGIGHRVLHGGEIYSDSILIDDEVLENIKSLIPLGPLHQPANIKGIESMMKILPDAPQVAVFDTAFHQTMPKYNFLYPVPLEWYEKYRVRKYGFHGTSYKYITEVMKEKLNKEDVNLIICHIGSGASISCIKGGVCYDTTMGFTPVSGLMMGTRCGSLDPSILEYVCKQSGMSISEVTKALNMESGLLGISGFSDCRDVEKQAALGNEDAKLALTMEYNRIAKYIAQYYLELKGNVDMIVFTAGVGENGTDVRYEVLKRLAPLGVVINEKTNDSIASYKNIQKGTITSADSKIKVYVMPTDEEIMILKDTFKIVHG